MIYDDINFVGNKYSGDKMQNYPLILLRESTYMTSFLYIT